MARPRKRVCLEDGLKLDLNQLFRDGTVLTAALTSPVGFFCMTRADSAKPTRLSHGDCQET